MKKVLLLLAALAALFVLNIAVGNVRIPLDAVWAVLTGGEVERASWRFIILQSRLPQAVTAILAGSGLAVTGMLLQTLFRNPLAGPDVFGISSGAALAVAIVMLAMGGAVSMAGMTLTGTLAIVAAAFVGALAVTGVIFLFSTVVRSNVMLLIIGMMVGYISGSAVTLLNFFATAEGVKSYMIWGMGTFGAVSLADLPLFAVVTFILVIAAMLLAKPLNAMLLGENYARNLGVNVKSLRRVLLVITGGLTAVITAYCGPVSFIGLATPHIARMLLRTDDHRILLPATALCGATIASLCCLVCTLPGENGVLPLSAITPLIGAPVIVYVIIHNS